MNDNTSTDKNPPGVPCECYHLGTDATGTEHWHSIHYDLVWLVNESDTVTTRSLNGRPVSVWVMYVRQERDPWQHVQPVEQRNGVAGLLADLHSEVA